MGNHSYGVGFSYTPSPNDRMLRGLLLFSFAIVSVNAFAQRWVRHTIDDSFRGADGVRLADFNADGRPDVVCGWEESGIIRVYLNPGAALADQRWPAVSVGKTASPEDAVPADIDQDGKLDVVSCHEGKAKRVLVHFNRAENNGQLLVESNWETAEFTQLRGQRWMFAIPMKLSDGRSALAVGSKDANASITLLISPEEAPRDLTRWKAVRLRKAGWIMSLRLWDMDGDGDEDIVYSDRKGSLRGVGWLEQRDEVSTEWIDHPIGAQDKEVMFIDLVPPQRKGDPPIVLATTRNAVWIEFRRQGDRWVATEKDNPPSVTHGKAIAQLSEDEWVMTANTHSGNVQRTAGIWWLRSDKPWQPIGADAGGKFDRMEVIDLNGDGYPDVMTCEERQNLGVIWYQHPGPQ